MAKRAVRRAHKARMKRKARKLYPRDPFGKVADYLAVCSCHMCRNPRHSNFSSGADRITRQERRFAERCRESD